MVEPALPLQPKRRGRPKKSPDALDASKRERRKQRPKTLRTVSAKASPEARRVGAAILEVLAGARTTSSAAEALGCTVPRYYQREARAFDGFLKGCEPVRPGREKSPRLEVEELKRKNQRLERECARLQSLVRVLQRSCSLPPSPPAPKKPGKKGKHRPKSRALVAVQILGEAAPNASAAPAPPTPEQT